MSRRTPIVLLFAACATILYLVALALDLWPSLRGTVTYALPLTLRRIWLPALLLLSYGYFCKWLWWQPLTRQSRQMGLFVAAVFTPMLQLSLLFVHKSDPLEVLFERTVSPFSGGFFNVGVSIVNVGHFLRDYTELMPTFPGYPQHYPPGLPLLFQSAGRLLARAPHLSQSLADSVRLYQCHNVPLMSLANSFLGSAWVQMLLPFWLGLFVWPIYQMGKAWVDNATGLRAALLWPLVPGVALWAAQWNPFFAIFPLAAFFMLQRGLDGRRLWPFFYTGLVVGIASFFNLSLIVTLPLLAMYAFFSWLGWADRPRPTWLVSGLTLSLLGSVILWLGIRLILQMDVIGLWRIALGDYLASLRRDVPWLAQNLYSFFSFLGIPILVLWLAQLLRSLVTIPQRLDRSLAVPLVLGALLLAGVVQGEMVKVAAFLFPFFLIPAVNRFARDPRVFVGLVALLAAQTFLSNLVLHPVQARLDDPPPAPPPVSVTQMPIATWRDGPELVSVSLTQSAEPNMLLTAATVWSATEQVSYPYDVVLEVVGEDGIVASQSQSQPLGGAWPATCWQPGRAFSDTYQVALPTLAGKYEVQMGLLWAAAGKRQSLMGNDANRVTIGTIVISADTNDTP